MHILHVPSVFLTNRTREEKGLWLCLMRTECNSSLSIFSVSSGKNGIGRALQKLATLPLEEECHGHETQPVVDL
jgi:hypothetical protein